jgi:hypothetical protein
MTTKKRKRKNGEEQAAAALSEAFHGRPARTVRDVEELYNERTTLADLGRLIELIIETDRYEATLRFKGNIRVAASPDGGSLYFVGGDQSLDLNELGLGRYLPKDHITVGRVRKIVYFTSKAFHSFEPSEYEHEFGEEGGELPILGYDVRSRKQYLTGGSYQVKPEGIRN